MSLSLARSRRRWGEKGRGAVAWEQGTQQVHPQRRVLHFDGDLEPALSSDELGSSLSCGSALLISAFHCPVPFSYRGPSFLRALRQDLQCSMLTWVNIHVVERRR
jgi:hypothetical protein